MRIQIHLEHKWGGDFVQNRRGPLGARGSRFGPRVWVGDATLSIRPSQTLSLSVLPLQTDLRDRIRRLRFVTRMLHFQPLKCYLIRGQFDSFTNVIETRILGFENKSANESAKHIFQFWTFQKFEVCCREKFLTACSVISTKMRIKLKESKEFSVRNFWWQQNSNILKLWMSRILFALRLSTIDSKLVILEDSKIFEVKYWNVFMCQKIEIADFCWYGWLW